MADAEAAFQKAEADKERARISAVVRAGQNLGRGRQALRAALLAPVGVTMLAGILSSTVPDGEAEPEAVAVPDHAGFGSIAAQAERRRIAGAFSRPEATSRFDAVAALVLEGDSGLTGEQIAPLLATLPVTTSQPRRMTIEERAKGEAEFGSDYTPRMSASERIDAGWRKAVAAANAQIGAAATIFQQADHGPFALPDQLVGQPFSADHLMYVNGQPVNRSNG
ncbi:hypothetical protein [Neogemmobacter tilapiae]|uniref:hypothetical protein n=1 Tax=Neogemmobacter tilapiae TaxID=875041 RepID=UPI001676C6F0|nr:hypothetical protein [Gemmobacter tilapiae]